MIIDDNEVVAEGLAMFLKPFTVQIALNGPQEIIEAEQYALDVVILDIGMPNMDGFEVAHRLRAMPNTQHILLIALSGYAKNQDDDPCTADFDYYLTT